MNTQSPAPMGHNNPPTEAEAMREDMADRNRKALQRAEDLIAAADRVPTEIDLTEEGAEVSGKITDLERQITVCFRALDEARTTDKAPYLAMTRTVDEFFRPTLTTLESAKARVKKVQTNYLVKRENAERKRREDLAAEERKKTEAAAAEAAKLEQAGKHSEAAKVMDQAVVADQNASFFQNASQAKGASVASTTGDMTGARSSLRYVWTGEVLDRNVLDLEALRPFLAMDALQKALNQFVKLNQGTRQIKGAKIWEKPDTMTR